MEVDVIEGRLDLIHQVERGRPGREDREQEREGGERAFAARQQRDALHALAAGRRLDLDPRLEGARRIRQDQASLAAGEQLRDEPLELHRDVPVGCGERFGDLAVDLGDQLQEVSPRRPNVIELALHEVVSLLHRSEFADGKEVDPAQQSETPLHQLLSLRDALRRSAVVIRNKTNP